MLVRNKHNRVYHVPNTDKFWIAQLTKDIFQFKNILTLRKLCAYPRTVIDIGANVGSNTIEYCTYGMEVHSFEPTTDLYNCLVTNIELNVKPDMNVNMYNGTTVYTGNVHTYKVALGNENATKYIQTHLDNKGRNYLMNGPSNSSEKIECRTLDSYEFTNVDVIKIDTEGYELFVLQGAIETIMRDRPIIQTECDNVLFARYGLSINDILSFMNEINYTMVAQHNHDMFWKYNEH